MNRQIGVKNFIRVVILDLPPIKGHVIQRMRNPKIAMVRYVQPKGRLMILQVSQKLQNRSTLNFYNIWTTKMFPTMQYCDVITNPRWRTAAILKIAKSYLSEKSSDFDEIWYTTTYNKPNDSHGGKGSSRLLKMNGADHTTFYWSAIVSIALCCTIFELFDVEYICVFWFAGVSVIHLYLCSGSLERISHDYV